eukprot:TRINITY_DN2664_c0_g1_i5.p1 TRINITY_DN2664_c0_g1~~TRINITY_DN2664_c0_g1_i5.p1  ORF type:complete len:255 (-),score=42.59 TRINITY_DN2664_c0_g1_i5:703-1467(-)
METTSDILFNDSQDWSQLPLFMDEISLDDVPDDNVHLLALKELLEHEDSLEEIVGEWKEKGNHCFKTALGITKETSVSKEKREVATKNWLHKSIGCYTLGIQARKGEQTDLVTRSLLFSNRAACNMKLENYGKVIQDCKEAIHLDPTNLKAFWRAAKASNMIGKHHEALEFCNQGLQLSVTCKELLQEKEVSTQKLSQEEKEKIKRTSNQLKINSLKQEMLQKLNLKGIKMGPYLFPNLQDCAKVCFFFQELFL